MVPNLRSISFWFSNKKLKLILKDWCGETIRQIHLISSYEKYLKKYKFGKCKKYCLNVAQISISDNIITIGYINRGNN